MKYGIDTRCQHLADDNKDEIYGAISYPIYQSATFARDRSEEHTSELQSH